MGLSAEHRRVHIYDLCVYMHALESALEMGISVYSLLFFDLGFNLSLFSYCIYFKLQLS